MGGTGALEAENLELIPSTIINQVWDFVHEATSLLHFLTYTMDKTETCLGFLEPNFLSSYLLIMSGQVHASVHLLVNTSHPQRPHLITCVKDQNSTGKKKAYCYILIFLPNIMTVNINPAFKQILY